MGKTDACERFQGGVRVDWGKFRILSHLPSGSAICRLLGESNECIRNSVTSPIVDMYIKSNQSIGSSTNTQ